MILHRLNFVYIEPSGRAYGLPAGHILRNRHDDFVLPCKLNSLIDSNFIIRQLFKDSY